MITYSETIKGHLTNGLTWKITKEGGTLHLTILWANGEELDTIELKLEDIGRLEELFLQARGIFGAIAPSQKNKKGI